MRQGQSAVQASLELDMTSVEYDEDDTAVAGDVVSFFLYAISAAYVTGLLLQDAGLCHAQANFLAYIAFLEHCCQLTVKAIVQLCQYLL